MWIHFAFSWYFFLLKKNFWRTNNFETRNVPRFPVKTFAFLYECHRFSEWIVIILTSVFILFSTRESLCSQPTYLDGWHISAHAGSICCWAMAVSDQVQADTQPTAFQHSKGTLCLRPQPPSLQGATSPKPPSQTSTSAPSTGPWCLDSAACCR